MAIERRKVLWTKPLSTEDRGKTVVIKVEVTVAVNGYSAWDGYRRVVRWGWKWKDEERLQGFWTRKREAVAFMEKAIRRRERGY